jgi:hypothetical protein
MKNCLALNLSPTGRRESGNSAVSEFAEAEGCGGFVDLLLGLELAIECGEISLKAREL